MKTFPGPQSSVFGNFCHGVLSLHVYIQSPFADCLTPKIPITEFDATLSNSELRLWPALCILYCMVGLELTWCVLPGLGGLTFPCFALPDLRGLGLSSFALPDLRGLGLSSFAVPDLRGPSFTSFVLFGLSGLGFTLPILFVAEEELRGTGKITG